MNIRKRLNSKTLKVGIGILTMQGLIVACSDSNDGGITGTGAPFDTDSSLELYLKTGIAANNSFSCGGRFCDDVALESGDADQVASDGNGDSARGEFSSDEYSETNVQEQGVDELDWLKTDGDIVYSYNGGSHVNVFQLGEDAGEQKPLNTIELFDTENDRNYLRGLYLDESNSEDQLIAVSDRYVYDYSAEFWHWSSSKSEVKLYGLSTPTQDVSETANIVIDGQYVSSRKIGSKLYVISQFTAFIDDYVIYPLEDKQVDNNSALIKNVSVEELLPTITISGEEKPLISVDDCHIPGNPEEATQPTLAIVTTLDLSNPGDFSASCIAAPVSTIYASNNSVYMVEDQYDYRSESGGNQSNIFKLDYLNESNESGSFGLEFAGSIGLDGLVGWDEQFRLSESDGYLRVVTSDWSAPTDEVHRLHTVKIDDGTMSYAATIPSADQPTPIGKPGEMIESVRFNGDKAYIVTFERMDPFYVIDLSDAEAPFVAGELELPGFSSYLHPFGDDLVFGLGRGSDSGDPLATNEVKVALFDVSEPSAPSLIASHILEGDYSYTQAEYSHTALAILPSQDDTTWRIGFSASIYSENYWGWQQEEYVLLEVKEGDASQGTAPTMEYVGSIIGSDSKEDNLGIADRYYYNSYYDRGVLKGDYVHYSHNGKLITREWGEFD